MNFEMQPYIVYVKTDEQNRIQAVNSSAFLPDTEGWIEIDSGFGDRFHHAQGNYFEKPLYDDRGIMRYKLADGVPSERTQAEMDGDYVPPQAAPDGDNEKRIAALEEAMTAIVEGIASV